MELKVLSVSGLPERGVLAFRAGTSRQQAQLSSLENRVWELPCTPAECGTVKFEVLQSAARGRFTCEAEEQTYTVDLDLENDNGAAMQLRVQVRPSSGAKKEGNGSAPPSPNAKHKVSVAAHKYMEQYGLHDLFQSLLQKLFREKPSDPYAFLKAQIELAQQRAPPVVEVSSSFRRSSIPMLEERLSNVLSEHPYLEKDDTHPLQPLVKQCRELIKSASTDEGEKTLQRLIVGLESLAEASTSQELFVRKTEPVEEQKSVVPPALAAQEAQLAKLILENPYLEPGKTLHPHSLHHWVQRFRAAVSAGNIAEADLHLNRVTIGLESDKKRISEAFKRFDLDASGELNANESQHMCAYLGWSPADVNMMDVNADGRLTVTDFLAFVGTMGGVQRLFEQRRERIAQSRQDVANANTGVVAVGSRVRSHFYLNGAKSKNWQEAVVLAVGVKIKPDSPALGVMLEFGFTSESDVCWKARQVVPAKWVVSSVEDAAVAAALREVGILEEQQAFWSSILPESEMRAIGNLVGCQRNALAYIRKMATAAHDKAMPELRERFASMGHGEYELQAVLTWIQDLAPVVVHVHIDSIGKFMELDEFYRNQFETKTSCGALDEGNETRIGWERDLFGQAYENAKPFERCKYGALGVMNDYRGVTSASQYGDSYMVLKDVRLRCTFAATDSGGIMGSRLAVLDKYAHVLMEYNDTEMQNLIAVATSEEQGMPAQLLRGGSEDPTSQWVTFGFPDLQQNEGLFYFEVELSSGCQSPQVGLLSSKFVVAPYRDSTTGVGDDEHGWAVDGQHAARWHKGQPRGWGVSWPRQGDGDMGLSESVIVGIAVDFDSSKVWVSSNGVWDDCPAFDREDIPETSFLYPALSVQGRAAFIFGPSFKYAPPSDKGNFSVWPGTPGGYVRIDCPRVGNSDILDVYKEAQIHGEVCFAKHVQRLVATTRYRDEPKTQRSWALTLSGGGESDGEYDRVGVHDGRPLYKNSRGGTIFWKSADNFWCINSQGNFDSWTFCAPAGQESYEAPRGGWAVLPEERGRVPVEVFKKVMSSNDVSDAIVEQLVQTLSKTDAEGKTDVYRHTQDTSFQFELQKLAGDGTKDADKYWDEFLVASQKAFLCDAGFGNASVVTTAHPYPAKAYSFSQTVSCPGAEKMGIYFASSCRTYDSCATLEIKATCPEEVPIGKSVRLQEIPIENVISFGTICEGISASSWKVKLITKENEEQFAMCFNRSEYPDGVVRYIRYPDGVSVSSEIGGISLDKSFPLTPISVQNFNGPGPAQEAGVRESMFLDLEATLFGPSASAIASLEGDGLGEAPATVSEAYDRIEETFKRLQAALALSDVTIAFADGLLADIIAEVFVRYPKDKPIGDELELAFDDYGHLSVASVRSSGPAQSLGIGVGWQVDLERTFSQENPGKAPAMTEEELIGNVETLLTFSDVTIVFDPPSSSEATDGTNRTSMSCCGDDFPNGELASDTVQFKFSTDGDGGEFPDRRWGFFALVLPVGDGTFSKEDVDKIVAGYMDVTQRVRGIVDSPTLDKQFWNEGRLRALCRKFGWDFEWMSEDGERRRRVGERQQRLSALQMKSLSSKLGTVAQPDGFRVLASPP